MLNFLKKHPHIITLAILTLALLLRLPLLSGSFWLDEAAQALESIRPLNQQLDIVKDFQPPLLHLLTHFTALISHQEWWLRLFGALIPGLVTILAVIQIGRRLDNHLTGWLAAVLISFNSFHVFYSQELRPYSLPAMLASLSWLTLINLIQHQKIRAQLKNKKSPLQTSAINRENGLSKAQLEPYQLWLIFFLLTTLGLYSSFLYPFLVLAQLSFFLHRYLTQKQPSLLKPIIFSCLGAALAFSPWLPMFVKQLQTGQALRQTIPGWDQVVSLTQWEAPLLVLGKFLFGLVNLELNLIYIGLAVITVFTSGYFIFLRLRLQPHQQSNSSIQQNRTTFWLLFHWLLVPAVTSWLVSFWVPVVRPKRLLFLLPALFLLIAYGLAPAISTAFKLTKFSFLNQTSKLKTKRIINLGLLLFISVFLIQLFSLFKYWTEPRYQREDWRQLHRRITQALPVSDTIALFSFESAFAPWRWYNQHDQTQIKSLATGFNHIGDVPNLHQQLKPIFAYQYVLVFDYLRDLTDPEDDLPQAVRDFGYREIGLIDQTNIGFVHIYSHGEVVGQR